MDFGAKNLGLELWYDSVADGSPMQWWLDGRFPDARSGLHSGGLMVHGMRVLRSRILCWACVCACVRALLRWVFHAGCSR
eukprot:6370269-Alexandrium_andersonii.AAC.1